MKLFRILPLLALPLAASAAVINFSGGSQSSNLTTQAWVFGSSMWGTIDIGSATATSVVGFSSIPNPALFSWSFSDLELDLAASQSPGAATPGWEIYRELDGAPQPIIFSYNGTQWATAMLTDDHYRIDVSHNLDAGAVGSATFVLDGVLNPSGQAFYDEVLSLSGGSGVITASVFDFYPVDLNGQFSSNGTLTVIPEPGASAGWLALAALLLALWPRRKS